MENKKEDTEELKTELNESTSSYDFSDEESDIENFDLEEELLYLE